MAAFYGQSPDHFDDWPAQDVRFELEVFGRLREEGMYPLEQRLIEAIVEAFSKR